MGAVQSTPTFYHPDLLAAFCCDPVRTCKGQKWYRRFDNIIDPSWVRNSPLRIELVDLLNDVLKAMGGWPRFSGCCFGSTPHAHVAPQLVEAFNKVCKKFNDAKLFDMGLQCRAIIYRYLENGEGGPIYTSLLFVLVEKRSDEKLRDVGETLEHISWLEVMQNSFINRCHHFQSALAWSPPEDWMTRLPPPYNETTKFAQPCQDLRELREKWIGDHGFTLGLELGL